MTESVSIAGVFVSLLLPWIFGYVWLSCVLGRSYQWNRFIIAGHSYLGGMFLTTVIIRIWDFCGLPLNYWGLVAVISSLTIVACFVLRRWPVTAATPPNLPAMEKWQITLVAMLLLLIIYRYGSIAQEIVLRPLYPWDAWMNWAPKAVTWYHAGELVSYISPNEWLQNAEKATAYTTGAGNAWKYPVTIPLIQLWGMLGAGNNDQTFSNLPWLFAPLAFALALYGHLKLLGASTLLAVTACYIFLSIPYISVHSALAGYADLWLALIFGAAILSLHEWQRGGHWSWAAMVLFFAYTCTQLKLPGLVLGAIILSVFLTSMLRLSNKDKTVCSVLIVAFFIYVVFIGIRLKLPFFGPIELSADKLVLPYIGTLQLNYQPVHSALIETIFCMINWNILPYLFVAVLLMKIAHGELLKPPSLVLQTILLVLLFLGFVFYLTYFHEFVLDYSTVNRVLLYTVPAIVFYLSQYLSQSNGLGLIDRKEQRPAPYIADLKSL